MKEKTKNLQLHLVTNLCFVVDDRLDVDECVCVSVCLNEREKKVIDNNENGRVYLISVSFARADDLTTPYQDQIGIINTLGKPKCWCLRARETLARSIPCQ